MSEQLATTKWVLQLFGTNLRNRFGALVSIEGGRIVYVDWLELNYSVHVYLDDGEAYLRLFYSTVTMEVYSTKV